MTRRLDLAAPMYNDPVVRTRAGRGTDLDDGWCLVDYLPPPARRSMAENGIRPPVQQSRHEPSLDRNRWMAECVNPRMQLMEPTRPAPAGNRVPARAAGPELGGADHSPLLAGDPCRQKRSRFVPLRGTDPERFGHPPRIATILLRNKTATCHKTAPVAPSPAARPAPYLAASPSGTTETTRPWRPSLKTSVPAARA